MYDAKGLYPKFYRAAGCISDNFIFTNSPTLTPVAYNISSINEFLKNNNCDIIDIKYQVAITMFGEDQIYCFSAMVLYEEE